MSVARKKVSAVAFVSLVSVLFFTVLYRSIEPSLDNGMSDHITIEKEPIDKDLMAEKTVAYHSRKYLGSGKSAGQFHVSNTKKHKPALQKGSRKQIILEVSHKAPKKILKKGRRTKPIMSTVEYIESESTVSEEEEVAEYDQEVTTTEDPVDASTTTETPIIASPEDIKNRDFQYWLAEDNDYLPYNTSLVSQQQVQRHELIRKTCQKPKVKDTIYPVSEGHRSTISTYQNLLYCPILKAGSTNILRLLCWLRGPPCSTIENLFPHNMVPRFLNKGAKIAVGNTPEFLSYFSFALVRNPWKRLVSVYIQKFVETRQGLAFCQVKARFPLAFRYYKTHRGKPMPFKDYLEKCVIGQHLEGGILAQNGHWRPQYHMCSFCDLDFTFIGKIETMKSDERVIINAFGFDDVDQTIADANRHLLPNEKANKTSLLYEDLWADIGENTLGYLQKLYKIDFEMFDYPSHPLTS